MTGVGLIAILGISGMAMIVAVTMSIVFMKVSQVDSEM